MIVYVMDSVMDEFTLDTYFVLNMTVDAVFFIKQFQR